MKFINLYNILLESRLTDYKLQLKDDQLANSIFSLNNPKKEKMIIKWIKNGTLDYQNQKELIDKVYEIIQRKQLDYNNYDSPQQILDQYEDLSEQLDYNPDFQPCFSNKVDLGKGVVVYDVQDDEYGQLAVRKAVDYNWGKDSNPWCLINFDNGEDNVWKYWQQYNKIPKRICFQNGKLIAFCASDEDSEIKWWDRNNKPTTNIPIKGISDDPKVLKEIQQFNRDFEQSEKQHDPNKIREIYQKYKDKNSNKIIWNIAWNENCPKDILDELSYKKDLGIRTLVARNKNTSLETLRRLITDKHMYVQHAIRLNPNWIQ